MAAKRIRGEWQDDAVLLHDQFMEEVQQEERLLKINTKKPSLQPCGLPSRERERVLGESDGQVQCFGCSHVGEYDLGATSYEDIIAIFQMVRASIARVDPIVLAQFVAVRYKRIQDEVNENLQPHERPLPDWTAATILEHMRYHNTDAELQTWMRISEMQEMARIASDAVTVLNPDTGHKSLDPVQTKLYLEIVKTIESLSKSDPSKKVFFSSGKHVDIKAASDGFISKTGKNLVRYLGSKRRRRL